MDIDDNKVVSKRWLILCTASTLAVFFAFEHFGRGDQGVVAGFSLACIALAIQSRWDLRYRIWFWVAIGLISLVHIAAIFFVEWRLQLRPTILYAPAVIVDFACIVYLIYIIEYIVKAYKGGGGRD